MAAPRLMTLADLTPTQIKDFITMARSFKNTSKRVLPPTALLDGKKRWMAPPQSLHGMTIAFLFSKRSTRTRVSGESASNMLGGHALFLGRDDIQLGVNESARDTARIVGGMCQGIFARVGEHEEIEEIARYSPVPVINALSSLWHPMQVLADLQTLYEQQSFWLDPTSMQPHTAGLRPLTIAYVGDSANVLHDMLVTYPRLGHTMQVASPAAYRAPTPVWDRVVELGCDKGIRWTDDPLEAVQGADVVITDTWISMGQESEYEERVKAFKGYQVTEELCRLGNAKPDWKFMHCLPRKQHEVDDEVFYGPRSLVFPEADNRKWTTMAVFHSLFGKWTLDRPVPKRLQATEKAESNE
ncbi:putative ornithine carbamoyltransferase precursor [Phellopilus nigrolimitatus]|nr:putative ornithine carbamoyltransferase precursor [Phellopilus nigrolimitatus]